LSNFYRELYVMINKINKLQNSDLL